MNERIVEDLDFGMAMSDFLIIFPSDNSTVDFVEFIFFWPSCLWKGFPFILPLVFRSSLPLNGLFKGTRDDGGFEVVGRSES